MRISGSDSNGPSLGLLGNMSKLADKHSDLIFVYPMLFDKTLLKQWEMTLRDFLTTQFISQIKIANVLNITQAAVQGGYGQSQNTPYMNPAELLNNVLGDTSDVYRNALQTQLNAVQAQQFNNQNNNSTSSDTEYRYHLNELKQFIKQQILSNPTYTNENLRPAFSIITMENSFLEVPMIVGTKTYKIDSSALYWILFVSLMGNDLNLKNFAKIQDVITSIPKSQFLNFIRQSGIAQVPADRGPLDAVYNKLRAETNQSITKALKDFNTVTNTLNGFEQDIGFSTGISSDAVTYTNIVSQSMVEDAEIQAKTVQLVNQTLINTIFPLLQTINNLIVNPALETDYISRYKKLLEELNNKLIPISNNFREIFKNRLSNAESTEPLIKSLESSCKSLQQIKVTDILQRIQMVRLRFSEIRNAVDYAGNSRIYDFAEEMTVIASSLSTQTQTLMSTIYQFTGDNSINNIYSNLINSVKEDFRTYYISNEFGNPIVDLNLANPVSRFFASIFQGADKRDLVRFISNSIDALAEITVFLFFYSAFSYFCEFISIIKNKIELKAQDIVEFPNYTIVIPIEYVTTLYYALAARNTSDLLKSMSADNNINDLKLTETDVFKIINAIVSRLGVKNIIIVDSTKKEIYFKWCYSKRPIKLNESTLHNYIRSQSNITAAF